MGGGGGGAETMHLPMITGLFLRMKRYFVKIEIIYILLMRIMKNTLIITCNDEGSSQRINVVTPCQLAQSLLQLINENIFEFCRRGNFSH